MRTSEQAPSQLVDQVRAKGIRSEAVLEALRKVPRERFVPDGGRADAWADIALPIDCGQTISQPYTVAYQTQLLDPAPGDRVLEIGTGSGYQAAVLAELGAEVFSIERQAVLHEQARERLQRLGYHVHLRLGDGCEGWAEEAPFAGILITAGGATVPSQLMRQLQIGSGAAAGRLVMPVGPESGQRMVCLTRQGVEEFQWEEGDWFRFVPLVSPSEQ